MKNEKVEPAPCSRTALVRDRMMDEAKLEEKDRHERFKVPDQKWNDIVARMKEKEAQRRHNKDKPTTIKIQHSLKVTGNFVIIHEDGSEEQIDGKRSFCRCGLSSAMPFCDNTHRSKMKWVKKIEGD